MDVLSQAVHSMFELKACLSAGRAVYSANEEAEDRMQERHKACVNPVDKRDWSYTALSLQMQLLKEWVCSLSLSLSLSLMTNN